MNVCVLGDSHSRVFKHCDCDEVMFDVKIVEGATAQGSVNPNSMTNALEIFTNHIKTSLKKYDKVVIMLGEVDCGYLVWVRSKRYNISVESQIELCINNINTFIISVLLANGYKSDQIILCGAHLPTIKDNTDPKYLGGARKEVDVNQYERTIKTLEYNNLLEEVAKINGYNYIDITQNIIGKNGLVKNEYLNKNPGDHHLENSKIACFYKSKIKSML